MKATWTILYALLAAALTVAAGCDDSAECGTGEMVCGDVCVNTLNDSFNCGGCGNTCSAGQICTGGSCQCSGGGIACGTTCCSAGQVCYQNTCANSGSEVCNNTDDDLDGQIDENLSQPCNNPCGSGVESCRNGTWESCTAPEAEDEVCDGEDNDCDGQTDEGVGEDLFADADGDGFGDAAEPVLACPDTEGTSENDDDCDDTDDAVNPDADEVCGDLLDNNCDDALNEGCTGCALGQVQNCGEGGDTGECAFGTQTCTDSGSGPAWGACTGGTRPVAETCDGLDNDCDENIDDGMATDSYEGNDTCETARGPLIVEENGEEPLVIRGTLYTGDGTADEDWYIIDTNESDLDTCIIPWSDECNYHLNVTFTPPAGSDETDWELCMNAREDDVCTGTVLYDACTAPTDWDDTAGQYAFALTWPGQCWFEDGLNFFTVIRAATGATVNNCTEYEATFEFLFIEEECAETP
jgi:hypothetical protein